MIAQTLPMPNIGDWCTVRGAAGLLGKSESQVKRYMAEQRIRSYRPLGARDRLAEHLLWVPEVKDFRDAQQKIRRPAAIEAAARAVASKRV
jgi:hypothetical protein